MSVTTTRDGRPTPMLEITTAAVRNPGVTLELEPGGVSGGGREMSNCYSFSCAAALQVYQYGNTNIQWVDIEKHSETSQFPFTFATVCHGTTPMTTLSDVYI